MANSLRRTPEYRRAMKDLRFSARLLLPAIEERIADDPDHRRHRFDLMFDGHPAVMERDPNADLLIYFHRVDSSTVSLDLVVDLRDPPDWFIQPEGTWADDLA